MRHEMREAFGHRQAIPRAPPFIAMASAFAFLYLAMVYALCAWRHDDYSQDMMNYLTFPLME